MVSFLSKLFSREKKRENLNPEELIKFTMDGVIEKSGLALTYVLTQENDGYMIHLEGADGHLLTDRDGMVLDAFQTYAKRLLQNRFPTERLEVSVDCNGYLESSANELRELADRLKKVVIEKGQPAYVRALMPRDRKIVHRHLAQDTRVRSQSIGEGFLKKIKIFSAERTTAPRNQENNESRSFGNEAPQQN